MPSLEFAQEPDPKSLIAAFRCLLFCNFRQIREIWRKRVGVENITDMNLKDLEGILGNTKSLKRNNKELEEILIVPSMFPRFCFDVQDSAFVNSTHTPNRGVGFQAQISRHGWQADHRSLPRNATQSERPESLGRENEAGDACKRRIARGKYGVAIELRSRAARSQTQTSNAAILTRKLRP